MRFSLVCILSLFFFLSVEIACDHSFEIFIDAGSTGSSIHVFKEERANKQNRSLSLSKVYISNSIQKSLDLYHLSATNCTTQCASFYASTNKLLPGISTFSSESNHIAHHITILLAHVQSAIPQKSLAVVHVAGTGSIINDPMRDKKLKIVRTTIESLGWKTGTIRITKPMEEAMFGWLGANVHTLEIGKTQPFIDLGSQNLHMAIESSVKCKDCLITWVNRRKRYIRAHSINGAGVSVAYRLQKWTECWNNTYSNCLEATRNYATQILFRIEGIKSDARPYAAGGLPDIINNARYKNSKENQNTLVNYTFADEMCRSNSLSHGMSYCFCLAWSQAALEITTGVLDSIVLINTSPYPLGAIMHSKLCKIQENEKIYSALRIYIVVGVCIIGLIIFLVATIVIVLWKRKEVSMASTED